MILVEVNNLTKKYRNFTLDNVNFVLEDGRIYGLVGENGSGKSTSMKAITGLLHPNEGTIKIFDKPIEELTIDEKEKIGFTMDEICLPETLKIKNIVKIFEKTFNYWDSKIFNEYLNRFSIDSSKKIKELSKGMKAKLNIAISLSHKADVLILDEPMNGLDPVARDELCEILIDFAYKVPNKVILLSSHILSDLEKICTDYIFIHNGKVLLEETKEKLEKSFLKLTLLDEEFKNFDKEKIVRYKETPGKIEVLVVNNEETKNLLNAKEATPEDILIFLIRGKTI